MTWQALSVRPQLQMTTATIRALNLQHHKVEALLTVTDRLNWWEETIKPFVLHAESQLTAGSDKARLTLSCLFLKPLRLIQLNNSNTLRSRLKTVMTVLSVRPLAYPVCPKTS